MQKVVPLILILPNPSYDGIKNLGAPSTAATYNFQSRLDDDFEHMIIVTKNYELEDKLEIMMRKMNTMRTKMMRTMKLYVTFNYQASKMTILNWQAPKTTISNYQASKMTILN